MGTTIEGFGLAFSATQQASSKVDLAALVEVYAPLLFRVAHSVVRNSAEAEDIVQDAFVRVLEHQHKLPEIREMRVWLVRIAWNLALDRRRRIRPDQMDDIFAQSLAGDTLPAEEALWSAQKMSTVMREMERLPGHEKQVLLLTAMEELSTAEISAVMQKSESAVRALLFRARSRLRERVEYAMKQGGQR